MTFGGIREILDDNGATYTQHSEINNYTTQMLQDVPTDITLNCSYSNSHKQIQQNMYKMVKFDTRKCKTNISFHNDTLADGKMLTGFIYMYIVLFWRFFLFCSTFVNILPVSPFFDKNWI